MARWRAAGERDRTGGPSHKRPFKEPNMSDLDFNAAACRGRQQRILAEMQKLRLDLVIVQQIEHVQYLTGARYPWTMSPAAALRADGHFTLVAPKKPVLENAADEVVTYEAQ